MKTGRQDLDAMLRVASIPADESTFLLRAQDPNAAATVRAWVEISKHAGVPKAVLEQALRQADAMERWPVKKLPNADHLTEDEAKQLAYAHSRRLWNHGRITRAAAGAAAMIYFLDRVMEAEEPDIHALADDAKELRALLTSGAADA